MQTIKKKKKAEEKRRKSDRLAWKHMKSANMEQLIDLFSFFYNRICDKMRVRTGGLDQWGSKGRTIY